MIHLTKFTDKNVENTYNELKSSTKFTKWVIEYRQGYVGTMIPGLAADGIIQPGSCQLYDFARNNICYMEKACQNLVAGGECREDYTYIDLCMDANWLYNLDTIRENITNILRFRALFYCKEKKLDISERQMNLIFDIDMKKIEYLDDLFDKVEKIANVQAEVTCKVD